MTVGKLLKLLENVWPNIEVRIADYDWEHAEYRYGDLATVVFNGETNTVDLKRVPDLESRSP